MDDSASARILDSIAALAADVAALKSRQLDQPFPAASSSSSSTHDNPVLKAPGNADQFKFCSALQDNLHAALDCLVEDDYGDWQLQSRASFNKLAAELQKASTLITQRQKLIRLADRSEHGWAVVPFYLADPLASDEDDEKRMKAAGKAAAADRVKQQQKTASGDVLKPISFNCRRLGNVKTYVVCFSFSAFFSFCMVRALSTS